MKYWLGTQFVGCYNGRLRFGIPVIDSNGKLRQTVQYGYSNGYFEYSFGVRPVVSLQSNINLKFNETSEEWEFKN